jgi:hypothetical protein
MMMPDDPPPGGGGQTPPQPPPAPPRQVADPAAEVERLSREIANVRAEAASHRIGERQANEQVAAANTRITELQAEAERRVAETRTRMDTDLQAERTARIDAELRAAAAVAGLEDLDLIGLPTFPKSGVKVENGAVVGIAEAITAFKAAKPNYFRAPASPPPPPAPQPRAAGASGAPPPNPNPPPVSVKSMTPIEYAAYKRSQLGLLRRL